MARYGGRHFYKMQQNNIDLLARLVPATILSIPFTVVGMLVVFVVLGVLFSITGVVAGALGAVLRPILSPIVSPLLDMF